MKTLLLTTLCTVLLTTQVQAVPGYCSATVDDTCTREIKNVTAEALIAHGFDSKKVNAWVKSSDRSLTIDFRNKVITPSNHPFHMTLCDSTPAHAPNCAAIPPLYARQGKKVADLANNLKNFYEEILPKENFRPKVTVAESMGRWITLKLKPAQLKDSRSFLMDNEAISQANAHVSLFIEADTMAATNRKQRMGPVAVLSDGDDVKDAVVEAISRGMAGKEITFMGVSCSAEEE